ncbi:hypothetical protein BC831DRAFT_461360 [Entophlyctis helioformis]|nr:hypothetical protein BC831DRAFT_461360 [Entophlyctis helioformis]
MCNRCTLTSPAPPSACMPVSMSMSMSTPAGHLPSRYALQRLQFETLVHALRLPEPHTRFLRHLFASFGETTNAASLDANQVLDFRVYCASLAVFVDGPLSERLRFAFEVYDVDDEIEW